MLQALSFALSIAHHIGMQLPQEWQHCLPPPPGKHGTLGQAAPQQPDESPIHRGKFAPASDERPQDLLERCMRLQLLLEQSTVRFQPHQFALKRQALRYIAVQCKRLGGFNLWLAMLRPLQIPRHLQREAVLSGVKGLPRRGDLRLPRLDVGVALRGYLRLR